ncbi:HDOD domain-containing protein [Coralloluteibacterium thermophilus]|uniref:diguanylate cyclase n=1 Tax=Coralloluteibacterium thermophilum TaxID=2707049 RepID=A0ABV9NN03_9GAMM
MHPELAARLLHTRNLPTPSGVALRVVALAEDPNVELADVANLLLRDPALAAKIMRTANSPLYATQRRVENLRQALTLLGLNGALTLALGFLLSRTLHRPGPPMAPDLVRIWQRAALCATICRVLATHLRMPRGEELMLAGLMRDIGALALAHLEPVLYAEVCRQARDEAELQALERARFGADRAEVGRAIARHWRLPDYLVLAIEESRNLPCSERFVTCVAVAAVVAEAWLAEDAVAARRRAGDALREHLGIERGGFAEILAQVSEAYPEISALFELERTPADPERIESLLEYARELMVLRNLSQLNESHRRAQDAERLVERARAAEEQARRDPLTGTYNRMRLEEVLQKEFDSAARYDWPLSIAFLDLDDFKLVNDRYGHLVGDEVLRNFARLVTRTLRTSDIVARYGGEEFLLVLPGTTAEAASAVLNRLLEIVARTPMAEAAGEVIHVTTSAGLATQGGTDQHASVQDLLRAADEALYAAKRSGRNRVLGEQPDASRA